MLGGMHAALLVLGEAVGSAGSRRVDSVMAACGLMNVENRDILAAARSAAKGIIRPPPVHGATGEAGEAWLEAAGSAGVAHIAERVWAAFEAGELHGARTTGICDCARSKDCDLAREMSDEEKGRINSAADWGARGNPTWTTGNLGT